MKLDRTKIAIRKEKDRPSDKSDVCGSLRAEKAQYRQSIFHEKKTAAKKSL